MKNKIILWIAGVALALVGWLVGLVPQSPLGGIASTDAYNATTTSSQSASASLSFPVCVGNCVLGSIVVVQPASAGYMSVWMATTTATSTIAASQASTTASITWGKKLLTVSGASDVVGTLIFDWMVVPLGIVVETSSDFNGEYIVTYKK